jgi:CubicO group peptidase (beta-lactamase class C family)
VETVTGKAIEALMQEELFIPVKMTRTSMVWEPRFESDFANGYDEYGRSLGPEKRRSANAAGSMQTTLRDYATFLSALMSGKILDRRTTGEMFDSQISIHSAHQFPSLAAENHPTVLNLHGTPGQRTKPGHRANPSPRRIQRALLSLPRLVG